MEILRGIRIVTFAALSIFAVTLTPSLASSAQLAPISQPTNVTPPMGSYDPAGDIGMFADEVGRSRFADIYTGMALTNQGPHVNIYLTKLDPQAKKAMMGSAPPDKFSFILSPHTEKQMQALHQAVTEQATALRSNGIHIVSFGPDVKTGKETIQVENLTSNETEYLNSLFGSENIEVQNATSKPMLFDNRSSDSSPWNGGDFITDGSNDCTSGFPAYAGSINYLITASHCFSQGEYIYNGSSGLSLGSFNSMGYISNQDVSNDGLDAELLNTTGYGGSNTMIWGGSSTSPTDDAVSGVTTSPVGYQVCQSGAFDGEICGLVIQSNNLCIDGGSHYVCHVVEATNTTGGIAGGQGDSGGPVFRFSGSYLEATGIVTAGGNPIPCTNYSTNRQCSATLYYTDINPILSEFGITIK